jgi:hypothetical protein
MGSDIILSQGTQKIHPPLKTESSTEAQPKRRLWIKATTGLERRHGLKKEWLVSGSLLLILKVQII